MNVYNIQIGHNYRLLNALIVNINGPYLFSCIFNKFSGQRSREANLQVVGKSDLTG
jgi:hypothetical protein